MSLPFAGHPKLPAFAIRWWLLACFLVEQVSYLSHGLIPLPRCLTCAPHYRPPCAAQMEKDDVRIGGAAAGGDRTKCCDDPSAVTGGAPF